MTRRHVFFGVSVLLFVTSALITIVWSTSMSAMGEMLMPGDWSMSMTWTRMPGQTWPGAAASFLGMWVVMMLAMMLPSLVPVLWNYRKAVSGANERHPGWRTSLVGAGYFFVWTVFGVAIFPLGVALAASRCDNPRLRGVPLAIGVVILIAGALQFTAWKGRQLACCRDESTRCIALPASAESALRHGVQLGLQCGPCCANLMVDLLAAGVMNLGAMAVVTAAITVERLAPAGEQSARAIGVIVVGAALLLITRVVGLA